MTDTTTEKSSTAAADDETSEMRFGAGETAWLAVVTVLAQGLFPTKANGSLLRTPAGTIVGSALIAGEHVAWLGTAVKVGQEHVMAPIASLPALVVGYWIMFRIWKAESARMYRAASSPANAGREREPGPDA